jgi:uncharacterized protein
LYEIAESYFYGKGVNVDFKKALEYYEYIVISCKEHYNYTDSVHKLGLCYYYGLGVKRDLNHAKECLEFVVEQEGYQDAQELLDLIEKES